MEEGRASSPAMANLELDQVDSRGRRWRRFCISGQDYHVNMSVIEPYLQVLSHGGEFGDRHVGTELLWTVFYLGDV